MLIVYVIVPVTAVFNHYLLGVFYSMRSYLSYFVCKFRQLRNSMLALPTTIAFNIRASQAYI